MSRYLDIAEERLKEKKHRVEVAWQKYHDAKESAKKAQVIRDLAFNIYQDAKNELEKTPKRKRDLQDLQDLTKHWLNKYEEAEEYYQSLEMVKTECLETAKYEQVLYECAKDEVEFKKESIRFRKKLRKYWKKDAI